MAGRKRLSQLSERLSQPNERVSQPSERVRQRRELPGELTAIRNESGNCAPGADALLICDSGDLADGGDGMRFDVERNGETVPAFAIRHGGRAYAYLNRCAHIATELDWKLGKFFDADGVYLICSTHGALYAPDSGACRGGPCRGAALTGLDVLESDGKIYIRKG